MTALPGRKEAAAERFGIMAMRRAAAFATTALLFSMATPVEAGEAAADDSETDGCVESSEVMCLQDGRYEATLEWTKSDGEAGTARVARPRTTDSGLFYFFSYNNWEVLLKVLDGCTVNQHHWVYAASATDLGLRLVVRDTVSDQEKVWTKEPGSPAPAITDAGAFPGVCES
ncbi:MAG: hypothetical protein F4X59_06810 [Holophagales bacterium]|nr:hypothetical protein [Holophagales bacterium]MYC09829.1 hypothetical protein [Holophagales bacterium]